MMRDPRSQRVLLRRLAIRVRRGDRASAEVLGDRMMELDLEGIETGRRQSISFRVDPNWEHYEKDFEYLIPSTIPTMLSSGLLQGPPKLTVMGREVLYGVPAFAAVRTSSRWKEIEVSWETSAREIYRALRAQGFLPKRFRFAEMKFVQKQRGDSTIRIYVFENERRKKKHQDLLELERLPMRYSLDDVLRQSTSL